MSEYEENDSNERMTGIKKSSTIAREYEGAIDAQKEGAKRIGQNAKKLFEP